MDLCRSFLLLYLQALEEQFPEEDGYKITRYDAFTFNIEQPEVCITIVPCDESDQYTIALEPLSAKVYVSVVIGINMHSAAHI